MLPIFLIVLVDVMGFTLVIPLLSIYAERFSATPLQATLLVSAYAACQLISAPLLGRVSDRWGRKPILVLSQLGTFVGFIVLARAHALWVLYAARILDGATAGNLTVAEAYIADNTLPENRVKAFGLIGIAFGIGLFVGPFVSGALVAFGLTVPIYAAAGLSLASILCTLVLLPTGRAVAKTEPKNPSTTRVTGPGRHILLRPALRGIFGQWFCFMMSFWIFGSGFALFAERTLHWHRAPFGPREIGFVLAWNGLVGIVLQVGLIGRLVTRFGEHALVRTGFAMLFFGYLWLAHVDSVGPLVGVVAILSFANGLVRPGLMSLVTRKVGRREVGGVLGMNQSLLAMAQVVAPMVTGVLIGHVWLAAWARLASLAALVGLALAQGSRDGIRALVERHFAGTISQVEERSMRPHLPACESCRTYYERHLVLSRLDPDALAAEERLGRGLGIRCQFDESGAH
jgi:MFS transporter, DHA1 family, tetracycline resistance protein